MSVLNLFSFSYDFLKINFDWGGGGGGGGGGKGIERIDIVRMSNYQKFTAEEEIQIKGWT